MSGLWSLVWFVIWWCHLTTETLILDTQPIIWSKTMIHDGVDTRSLGFNIPIPEQPTWELVIIYQIWNINRKIFTIRYLYIKGIRRWQMTILTCWSKMLRIVFWYKKLNKTMWTLFYITSYLDLFTTFKTNGNEIKIFQIC